MTGSLALVVPAFEPNDHLVAVVRQTIDSDADRLFRAVIVVDDGSGPAYADVFERVAGMRIATVIRRDRNGGQGLALKTGFARALGLAPAIAGVVTADADGQHAPDDIVRVARALDADPRAFVLGVRRLGRGVPLRSRIGNGLARRALTWATGATLTDTQTGLRGYCRAWCERSRAVGGERYEFNAAVLMAALAAGERIEEVAIATIYGAPGHPSHFRPIRDSARVLAAIHRYM